MWYERYKKLVPVVEVVVVCIAAVALGKVLKGTGFRGWQVVHFGFGYLSQTLGLFVVPLVAIIVSRRPAYDYGLTTRNLAYHLTAGLKTAAIVMPVCLLFPIVAWLGTAHDKWAGSIALSVGFLLGSAAAVLWLPTGPPARASTVEARELAAPVVLTAVCFLVGWLLLPLSKVLAGVLYMFVFHGLLEEFFFRGYVQSRLNHAFGRPFTLVGMRFGPGLILASVLFGLSHLLQSGPEYPWAVWTTAGGLLFGLVREKTGAIIAPGLAHGLFIAPAAIFSGS